MQRLILIFANSDACPISQCPKRFYKGKGNKNMTHQLGGTMVNGLHQFSTSNLPFITILHPNTITKSTTQMHPNQIIQSNTIVIPTLTSIKKTMTWCRDSLERKSCNCWQSSTIMQVYKQKHLATFSINLSQTMIPTTTTPTLALHSTSHKKECTTMS